ncbi:MAG: hypothetical protein GX847_10660 [Clostridiales bacterium]|nr:hypothetical protein [Clostridiales bacterium]
MKDFEEFKQVAKKTVETIADKSIELYKIAEEKTKLLAKMTKLSTEITLEKGNVRKLYREIGKKYYDLHKLSPENALAQPCAEVTISLDSITAKQMKFEELKSSLREKEKPEFACEEKDIEVEIILEETEETIQNESDTASVLQPEVSTEEATADTEDDTNRPPPEFKL